MTKHDASDGPTGREAYLMVADELDVPPDERRAVLDDLDPTIVELARQYAKRSHKRWPPRPLQTGWRVTTFHF